MAGSIRKIGIDRIQNYYQNPRHEIGANERDTLKKLFEAVGTQHMINLAEDIYRNGLMGGQQITVVASEEGKKYIVYEGNRRVAALKLLAKPENFDFLDKTTIDRIKRITKEGQKITHIDCYITDEKEAFFIMERRHSGEDKGRGVRPWSPREKEAFINRQNNKKSVSYLIDIYVKKHFNGFDITTIMPFTTLTRLFGNKGVRASIGLDISDEKTFTIDRMRLVIEAAKWVAQEAEQAGVSITRHFNKAQVIETTLIPWIINYKASQFNIQPIDGNIMPHQPPQAKVDNVPSEKGEKAAAGTDELDNAVGVSRENIAPPVQEEHSSDNRPANREQPIAEPVKHQIESSGSAKNLPYFFQGIDYSHLDPNDADTHGVAAVCHELKSFSDKRMVHSFPLCAAFLTRSIIEHSLIYYAKKHNIQGQNKSIYDSVGQCTKLSQIIANYKRNLPNYISDATMRQYFTALFDNYETNVDPLNWVVHRPSEYRLDTQSLIDLPRKGLLALINYLIA